MGKGPQSNSAESRKEVIERRYLSKHPLPSKHQDGAVPGALLLDQLAHRGDALRQRIAAATVAHAVSSSPSTTIYPGIALRPTLPGSQLPTSVAAGDFNKDGHMDFVIANGDTNDLWLYLGKGDGTFQLPQIIPLTKGLSPVYVAAADLRNSGNLDLVVAEYDTSTIGVLLNNGDGTFGYEQTYALPQPPGALVVDDFNHDGHLDIAAVMQTPEGYEGAVIPYVALLVGNGTGKFAAPAITNNNGFVSTATNLASGDVNGDGLPDLLITGQGLENSQVFLNKGDGTFSAGQTIIENLPFILLDGRLADVNGDGCQDAVVADAAFGVWVALGNCSGSFATPQVNPMGDSPAAVRVADINGDGIPDLVTTSTPLIGPFNVSSTGNTLDVAFGDGKGSFSPGRTYQGPGESLSFAVADFNADGKADVVTVNNDTSSATLYLNDGTGSFGFPQGIYSGLSSQGVALAPDVGPSFADLNGDGKTDTFFVGYSANSDFYAISFLNDGTGRFAPAVASDSGLVHQNIGDYRLGNFRNTGKLDLVAIGWDLQYSNSSQYILFMPGNGDGTFGKGTLVTPNGADGLLTTGDFNGDGKLDFVTVNGPLTHALTPFLGNGDGTFRAGNPITFSDSNGQIGRVFSGDFNRDGKLDVLVLTTDNVIPASPAVWEFLGNGDGTFQPGKELFTGFEDLTLADLNGDGCPDIAQYDLYLTTNPESAPSTAPATLTNFVCQPTGSFVQSSTYAPYTGTYDLLAQYYQFGDTSNSPLVGDFNGDGKVDEVGWQGGPDYSRYLQMLAGNGDGTFTPTYDIFPRYILNSPYYSRDLNGDGYSDLLQLSILSNSLNVIKGAPAPALQMELEEPVVTGNRGCGWVFPNVISISDRAVTLSSSVSGVVLPAAVTIPANAASAKFCYSLDGNFDWRQVFDINAQLNGDTATAYASDSYIFGFDETLSPSTVPVVYVGDSSQPLTISLHAAQGYASTVKLSCQAPTGNSCEFGSTSLALTSGSSASTTVVLNTSPATSYGEDVPFTIVADDGNVRKQQIIGQYVSTLDLETPVGGSIMALPGTSVSQSLTVLGIPPYSWSCSGLPAGATCSFSGNPLPYPSDSIYTNTLAVGNAVAPGNYTFQITVTSGSHSSSVSQTLAVLGVTLQGPPANNDWIFAGTTQTIPVTVQLSSNATSTTALQLTCSLDVTATCSGTSVSMQPGTQTADLTLSVPSGTATGQHQLTVLASLGGNTQSFTIPVAVVVLSGSLSASTMTLTRGASGSVTATLNATTGFVGSVSLTCGGTGEVSCAFNPVSVQLTGGTSQSATVTLTAGILADARTHDKLIRRSDTTKLAVVMPFVLLLGFRRRRWSRVLSVIVALCVLGSVTSCGGSGGSGAGSGGGGGGGGSGSNTYPITVTGTPNGTTASTTIGTISVTVSH